MTTLMLPIHSFLPSSLCIPACCFSHHRMTLCDGSCQGQGGLCVKQNEMLFFSHVTFGVCPCTRFSPFVCLHIVFCLLSLGVLTLFPRHSTWLCEVVDAHKQTDVLVTCHIWSLISHHISPFYVCCSVVCTLCSVVFLIQMLSIWMKEPSYILMLSFDYRKQSFAVCQEWKKHSNPDAQQWVLSTRSAFGGM